MKTGVITFHFTHNQGAVLQSFALQKVLQKLGYEAELIDYCPSYHTIRYSAKKNPFAMAKMNVIKQNGKGLIPNTINYAKGFLKGIYFSLAGTYKLREEKFNSFLSKNLKMSVKYKTLKQLRKNPPSYDFYISGSDQLWNPDLLDGNFDPAYFLNFGGESVKRLTYAVSMRESYTEKERGEMSELLKMIDCLSVRESNNVLDEISGNHYTVCIDPTLLLSKEDYSSVEAKNEEDSPYVFVYALENSLVLANAAGIIAEKLGASIINGSPEKIKISGAKLATDYSPDEFLSYIKNSKFVLTNSFHGTAFSIIYNKQFVTVPHTSRSKRMIELLDKLNISDRLWKDSTCDWQKEIDYEAANKNLEKLKEDSISYLLNSLKK